MKKVVASLVLASLVSSSASAVNVIGAVRSTTANATAYVTKNPKTVGLSAAGIFVVGSALLAYNYPEGKTRAACNAGYKMLNPRNWFGSTDTDKDSVDLAEIPTDDATAADAK